MTTLNQHVVLALLRGALLVPASANACAILPKEQAAELHRQAMTKAREQMLALRDEADLVFTGRLARLSFHQETRPPGPGRPPSVMQLHEAVFDRIDDIKGTYAEGQVLRFETNKSLVTIHCRFTGLEESLPKENGVDERYLVYARDGRILRTNHIVSIPQPLSGREEERLVRGMQ